MFGNTKFHDNINKATAGAGTVMFIIYFGSYIFTMYIPYFLFMGFYLNHLKPQFVFSIVLVFIPVLLGQLIRTRIISNFEDTVAPIRREYDFYYRTIIDREYYKETRILGAYRFFFNRFMHLLKRLGKEDLKVNKRTNQLELIVSLLSTAGYAGILYMLVTALLKGEITVGAFAAVFSSIGMLFSSMNELINLQNRKYSGKFGKCKKFYTFHRDVRTRRNRCHFGSRKRNNS